MKRLRPLDKALAAIVITLWVLCFALSTRSVLRDTAAFPPVYVSAPERGDAYPKLTGFRPWLRGKESGLRPGDRLIRAGDTDLRGMGPLEFFLEALNETGADKSLRVVFERGITRGSASLEMGSLAEAWTQLPASLTCAFVAVFLFLRARPSAMIRASFQALMCGAILFASLFGGSQTEAIASIVVRVLSSTLVTPLVLRALLLFPHDVPPASMWARAGPWLFATLGPLAASFAYGVPLRPDVGVPASVVGSAIVFATVLVVVTRTYRLADPIGRRQLKWVIFGIYCALVPAIFAYVLAAIDPRFSSLAFASTMTVALCPLFFLIAVIRFNRFDIDRLISATASYNILLVLLVTGGLVVVPRVSEATSAAIGIDPSPGQVILSLLLAAAVIPANRRLRPRIDRLFFPERSALERGIEGLLRDLSTCRGPEELLSRTGEGLEILVRPESCVIYGRAGEVFAPVFARGRIVPPGVDVTSRLVAALTAAAGPVRVEPWPRSASPLGAADRAVLESLAAVLLVPVSRASVLTAFLCLGSKRSGDIYTSTDLALFAAVADKASTELLRFDSVEVLRQAHAMQDKLRRYVPGAVAAQLESGRDLESGECEVSILFVDIRGYTAFSEGRAAAEVFSTVNRYTERVSEIVRRHGGSVVEFNGDGMMAVFGAPNPLREKERAAVETGKDIIAAMDSVTPGEESFDDASLAVGIGIATGTALVGNIQAVDRVIWTAIGNTPNLAARLQSLTRDLDAAMIIDGATLLASRGAAVGFEHHSDVPIRGRRDTQDVYALPLNRLP